MNEHESSNPADDTNADGAADALAVVALIVIAVATMIYWLSGL